VFNLSFSKSQHNTFCLGSHFESQSHILRGDLTPNPSCVCMPWLGCIYIPQIIVGVVGQKLHYQVVY
jgi:hypothetical protein